VRVSLDCSGEARRQGVGKREPCSLSFGEVGVSSGQ
jgi:hypothetical protein